MPLRGCVDTYPEVNMGGYAYTLIPSCADLDSIATRLFRPTLPATKMKNLLRTSFSSKMRRATKGVRTSCFLFEPCSDRVSHTLPQRPFTLLPAGMPPRVKKKNGWGGSMTTNASRITNFILISGPPAK